MQPGKFATELAFGTLRWRGKIDGQLAPLLKRSLADTDPFIRNLLRVTLYQLLFLDKIPAYAAVNEKTQQPGRVEQVRFNITIPRATNTPPANAKSPATDPKKK